MIRDGFVKKLAPDGVLTYHPDALEHEEANALAERLRMEIDWQQRWLTMFGRRVLQPRLICFMGDPGIEYRYSGDRHRATAWNPLVCDLRNRLEDSLGRQFNSVLLNAYRNGQDSMGWHADDETELGTCPTIASISLGAVRRFRLRSIRNHSETVTLEPAHGSLIVMSGDLQHHWQHQVPRTRRCSEWRLNLTFRRILDLRSRR